MTFWSWTLLVCWIQSGSSQVFSCCSCAELYEESPPFSAADLGWLLDLDLDPLLEEGVRLLDRDLDLDLDLDLEREWALVFLFLGERDLDLDLE